MGNIMIPKKIKVGFQKRDDTYTGQLAYVIYYDEKGVLRKETSWNSWRDDKIEAQDFDNVPTTGFVLNKKVGGYKSGWDIRNTYVRIYDPRNFEFEITIPNLLYILENTNSIKGKGLEGEFVYGWDGKELVLIPANAPEYQELMVTTTKVYDIGCIKADNLVIGNTYGDLNNNGYVYLGKSHYYDYKYQYKEVVDSSRYWSSYRSSEYYENQGYYKESNGVYWKYPLTDEWKTDKYKGTDYRIKVVKNPKVYWFYSITNKCIVNFKNLTKKLYSVIDNSMNNEYATYFDLLEHNKNYSPINYDNVDIEYMSYEEFEEKCLNIKSYDYFYYFKNKIEGIKTDSYGGKKDISVTSIRDLYEKIKPIKYKVYTLENKNIIKERP